MTTPIEKPDYLRLSCVVQTYVWGKVGLDGEVARLKSSADPDDFVVDDKQTYAELWMGTHPKGPSRISHPKELSGELLSNWLKSNQWALGDVVSKKFKGDLPFLFKVLSINKALSIQAHPSKSHAEALHRDSPELYRDPNHKPELAIAITDFEGFCGFRPFEEIQTFVLDVPELRDLVGKDACDMMGTVSGSDPTESQREVLRRVFTALMESEENMVKKKLKTLLERLSEKKNGIPEQDSSLLFRLNSQFPGDIGCFCVFFLNFVQLQPGESLYLAPNEPHAYLYGEMMECMACSDNVVRAGLTIKHRDKDTLCQMLTYITKSPEENKFLPYPHPTAPNIEVYDPPTPEFAVARITIPKGTEEFVLPETTGPSIFIILNGSGVITCGSSKDILQKGVTIFLPASCPEVKLIPDQSLDNEMLLFQAFCSI